MKLLGSVKRDVDKDKDGKMYQNQNMLKSFWCTVIQSITVFFTLVPNKQFGQLITISPHLVTMLKSTNTEFQSIQLWFNELLGRHYKNEILNRIKVQKIS